MLPVIRTTNEHVIKMMNSREFTRRTKRMRQKSAMRRAALLSKAGAAFGATVGKASCSQSQECASSSSDQRGIFSELLGMLAEKEPPAPAPALRVTDNRAESHVVDLVSAPVKSSPFEDGPSNERKAGANGSSRDLVSAPSRARHSRTGRPRNARRVRLAASVIQCSSVQMAKRTPSLHHRSS